jgi:hypothetical protein
MSHLADIAFKKGYATDVPKQRALRYQSRGYIREPS